MHGDKESEIKLFIGNVKSFSRAESNVFLMFNRYSLIGYRKY